MTVSCINHWVHYHFTVRFYMPYIYIVIRKSWNWYPIVLCPQKPSIKCVPLQTWKLYFEENLCKNTIIQKFKIDLHRSTTFSYKLTRKQTNLFISFMVGTPYCRSKFLYVQYVRCYFTDRWSCWLGRCPMVKCYSHPV